jgi:hypothetical protein
VLDPSVRAGKYNGLMTVVVTDEIRRCTVEASRLEDNSNVVTHPDSLALEVKMVTLGGLHGSSPLGIVFPSSLNRVGRALNSALNRHGVKGKACTPRAVLKVGAEPWDRMGERRAVSDRTQPAGQTGQ